MKSPFRLRQSEKHLTKDALKTTHRGDTEKYNVALFTKFLATKYFEANVVAEGASKWQEFELEFPRNFDLVVRRLPSVEISSHVGRISVTHHAINRAVERQMTDGLSDYVPGDITTIPDVKWSRVRIRINIATHSHRDHVSHSHLKVAW